MCACAQAQTTAALLSVVNCSLHATILLCQRKESFGFKKSIFFIICYLMSLILERLVFKSVNTDDENVCVGVCVCVCTHVSSVGL